MQSLSQAERRSKPRSQAQPEISLLRGRCLERQGLFVDAAETYRFIIERFLPANTPTAPVPDWNSASAGALSQRGAAGGTAGRALNTTPFM